MQRGLRARWRVATRSRRPRTVAGQVTQLEPGFCHVLLSADVRNLRRARIGGAVALAGLGAAGSVVAATIGVLAPFLALPAVGFGALALVALVAGRRHAAGERSRWRWSRCSTGWSGARFAPSTPLPGPRASAFVRIAEEIRKQFQI